MASLVLMALALAAFLLFSHVQENIRRAMYPLEYGGIIRSASAEYGMEPALVAAVIHTESGFDPQAVSGQGAHGLMQIVPETAAYTSRRSGIAGDYRDPRTNIWMGVWYLGYLEERYSGDERLMLAAYNAGEGSVDRWRQDESFDVREDIPYPETRNYVEDVKETRDVYAELYGSDLNRDSG